MEASRYLSLQKRKHPVYSNPSICISSSKQAWFESPKLKTYLTSYKEKTPPKTFNNLIFRSAACYLPHDQRSRQAGSTQIRPLNLVLPHTVFYVYRLNTHGKTDNIKEVKSMQASQNSLKSGISRAQFQPHLLYQLIARL